MEVDMQGYEYLTETLQKIKRAEERLIILIENKASLEEKVREKKVALDKENYDVEKLEGLSLEGFIHLLKGTLIDKLDKEEREAMVAKNQYEFACQELEVCMKEINICRERIKDKFLVERQYEDFIKKQEKQLIELGAETSEKIKLIIDQVVYHNEVTREIREAIEAGEQLCEAFDCISKSFDQASDLQIVEVLENGLLVSASGHQAVREANSKLVLIQQLIRKYHIELLDVFGVCEFQYDCENLLSFSDRFLESVMNRDSLEDKIKFAQSLLKDVMTDVLESIENLKTKKIDVAAIITALKQDKIKLIESYLESMGGMNEEVN